jgi:hypothetical protein
LEVLVWPDEDLLDGGEDEKGEKESEGGRYCRKWGRGQNQSLYKNSQMFYLMQIFFMSGRMRGVRRRVKGMYCRKWGRGQNQSLYNSQRFYLMQIFLMAVRMRWARRRVKGRYSRNGERWEASVFIQIDGGTGLT